MNVVRLKLLATCSAIWLCGCATIPENKLIESHCENQLMSHEKIKCYINAIQKKITQRLTSGVRQLSPSELPYEYTAIIKLDVSVNGKLLTVAMEQETISRQLNNKMIHSLQRIDSFAVPQSPLFEMGSFNQLELLIKPGRRAILGPEKKYPQHMLIIYLPTL